MKTAIFNNSTIVFYIMYTARELKRKQARKMSSVILILKDLCLLSSFLFVNRRCLTQTTHPHKAVNRLFLNVYYFIIIILFEWIIFLNDFFKFRL